MQCRKCNGRIPYRIIVEGKTRNLQNRKFCFECSPFGEHNTKDLIKDNTLTKEKTCITRSCRFCGKQIVRKKEKGTKCWSCTNKFQRQDKIKKIQQLIGKACWVCKYDKCWQALDLHHVDPTTKLFSLSTRELQFSWNKIEAEVKKCALLCCRCHREVHSNLIDKKTIIKLWEQNWNKEVETTDLQEYII